MLISTPTNIAHTLYEGSLVLSDIELRALEERSQDKLKDIAAEELPAITIGQPQWWNIAEIYRYENKPVPTIIGLEPTADFLLVQFACSFHPGPRTDIEWARVMINVTSADESMPNPLALDLHPFEVLDERRQDVKISLLPTLKFQEVEASLGEITVAVQYKQLYPLVTAVGVQENSFGWDLRGTKQYPLRGIRLFHAVIKQPRRGAGINLTFKVLADVLTSKILVRTQTSQAAALSCVIQQPEMKAIQ